MAGSDKYLTKLRDPLSIKNSALASSPYVLRKVFAADPVIQRLIMTGEKVIPEIAAEMRRPASLDDITLAAFAYIVESIKPETAPQVLGPAFRKAVEKPGPFFVHFAAHAIRRGLRLPIRPLEMAYSRGELIETERMLP